MLRLIKNLVLCAAILIAINIPAFAWDETGHKITAYIAWQQMTPATRERVIKILLAAPEDSQIGTFYLPYGSRSADARRREYFMLMATWPDIVRDKAFDTRFKKYNNGNWHYADTFWQWKDGKAVIVEGIEDNGQAMKKLTDFDQLIRGTASDAEKAVAIVWLEHLIGDIHQPLHTSGKVSDANPKGDQGGNLFLLTPKGTTRENQKNLHSYWDGIIGVNMPNTKDQCDADYLDPIAQEIMRLFPYDKMKEKISPAKYDVWAKESLNFAMTEVYKDIKFFETPSDKYKKKALEIGQEQMALAGYRMGDLFNEVFGGKPAVASADEIPCKVIQKVWYPVTQTSSVKQTLEIALLDLCPVQVAARPMLPFMINGSPVMKEYDVIKVFKSEAEARKYAAENNIKSVSF
ncbi:MAG: S1/P1 nuclease [Pyrinomonadaceae bacterium]